MSKYNKYVKYNLNYIFQEERYLLLNACELFVILCICVLYLYYIKFDLRYVSSDVSVKILFQYVISV